ncbi:MAG TPA: endoribonuclease MazF [Longimicrobiaceae bacterium]|nr:endoribonuclease MazF [Longimicrobiaceae bacterium]
MSEAEYIPERGDIVWISFNPQSGHEQAGRRPALTLSPGSYNSKAGLALFCPITSQKKGYPFEVALPAGLPVHGVALVDQIKSLDWRSRQVSPITQVPAVVLHEALGKIEVLLKL